MKPLFSEVVQVSCVVRDIYETVRTYADKYGIGPWKIWDFDSDSVGNMLQHGQKKDYAMRAAVTHIGAMEWELIQPLDDENIFAEFLREHGEGLHHIAFQTTESFDATMESARERGVTIEFQGSIGGQHNYAYLGLQKDLKVIPEIYFTQPGFQLPPPTAVYPPEEAQA